MHKSDLTIVIPAKQEKESLPLVLKELENYEFKKKVVVDQNDRETIIEAEKYPDVEILYQKKSGVGSAIIEGVESCTTLHFCILMADGSTDSKYLQKKLNKSLNENLDFVFSSRYKDDKSGSDDDTIITSIGNFFFTKISNILFKLGLSDILFNYVLGKTNSFRNLKLQSIDHRICIELPVKAKIKGMTYASVSSFERKRFGGKKKVNALIDGWLILTEIIKLFLNKKNL